MDVRELHTDLSESLMRAMRLPPLDALTRVRKSLLHEAYLPAERRFMPKLDPG